MISSDLLEEIQQCKKCLSISNYNKFSLVSHGKIESSYMLISEAPGKKSLNNGQYWKGKGGQIIRTVMSEFDKELEDVFYLTDIVKCWPNENGMNRKPLQTEIRNCSVFLEREISELKPNLIIAFGKTLAEYLLNDKVSMKESHGKVYRSRGTKILVLYHPSRIDQFMNRDLYKSQLRNLFSKLVTNSKDDFEVHLSQNIKKEYTTKKNINQEKVIYTNSTFVLPASGNSITEGDVKRGYLRITKDHKKYFPNDSCDVVIIVMNKTYNVSFKHRGQRSHLLKIGKENMSILGIKSGGSVKINVISDRKYKLEKLQ
ncbi:MAG: hypothetical protein FH751_00025 [Firmicutes bacterium]|nr:hypothetical protein [Bacillota bacterium]MTI68627.1 hypothetical protein [Bacillota bacterium]